MSIEEGQEDVLEIALQEKLVKKGQKIISCNDEGHFSEGLKRAQERSNSQSDLILFKRLHQDLPLFCAKLPNYTRQNWIAVLSITRT